MTTIKLVECDDCGGEACLDAETGACLHHEMWVMCRTCATLYPLVEGVTCHGGAPGAPQEEKISFWCPACEVHAEPLDSHELHLLQDGEKARAGKVLGYTGMESRIR